MGVDVGGLPVSGADSTGSLRQAPLLSVTRREGAGRAERDALWRKCALTSFMSVPQNVTRFAAAVTPVALPAMGRLTSVS